MYPDRLSELWIDPATGLYYRYWHLRGGWAMIDVAGPWTAAEALAIARQGVQAFDWEPGDSPISPVSLSHAPITLEAFLALYSRRGIEMMVDESAGR